MGMEEIARLIGNICGYVVVVLGALMFISTKRKQILMIKLISEIFSFANMILLGLFTGAALNVLNIGRSLVFYYREEKKWAQSYLWLFVFLAITLISPIMTWAGPISLLPAFGSALACIGYYMKHPLAMKSFILPGITLWLVYTLLAENYPSAIANVLAIISLVIGIVREILKLRKKESP
ncbi:MAG: YgjV family protein [Clostridia bacterium]|nr:YgjV family protein [Clostridia bacterium]